MSTREKDDVFYMFDYWEDKKGIHRALEEYYPHALKNDEVLRAAYSQLKIAENTIKSRMLKLRIEEAECGGN